MPLFQWITFAQVKTALASRLADPGMVFWVDDELGRYVKEALRTWNALTNIWNADFDLSPIVTANQIWYPLQSQAGYPRKRTVSDQEIEILMAYHLLEPPGLGAGGFGFNFGFNFGFGNSPPGTGMFTMQEMSDALQRRRDEIIQITACNIAEITVPTTPNTRTNFFPDTTLSPLRARFVPFPGLGQNPRTLWRNDDLALEYFSPNYLQGQPNKFQSPGTGPKEYGVITKPPLGFSVDFPPSVPGSYDFIVVEAATPLDPPASSILGLPNDFCWVAKWGAMSDLLGMESEATDPERADYCLQRYRDGITLMQKAPWLLLATLNGVAIETASMQEMDDYALEWDSTPQTQSIVTAGTDFLAISPVPGAPPPPLPGATITVVGNAPVPLYDSDFVQVSRDTIDAILDYAQHLADFKMGGADFAQSKELAKNFFLAAIATNSRLAQLGLFRDLLLAQGTRQGEADPRFTKEEK
jgi:hypothetical protein